MAKDLSIMVNELSVLIKALSILDKALSIMDKGPVSNGQDQVPSFVPEQDHELEWGL